MRARRIGRPSMATALITAAIALGGCAPMVRLAPTSFTPVATTPVQAERRVASTAEVRLNSGYTRQIRADSRWRLAGSLPQGQVYRPVDTVFTIEGRHVHEAYLVVAADQLVGFYLPGEGNYSPLSSPIPLSFGVNP